MPRKRICSFPTNEIIYNMTILNDNKQYEYSINLFDKLTLLLACSECGDETWGLDCKLKCDCSGHGTCAPISGHCQCMAGKLIL